MRVMFPLMNLIITKWLLVYVLENKHNFYVIHFLSLTVMILLMFPELSFYKNVVHIATYEVGISLDRFLTDDLKTYLEI